MKFTKYLFLLCFLLILLGCEEDVLSPKKYIAWIESRGNGMIVEKEINNYHFSTFFRPVDYQVVKELGQSTISKETLKEKRAEMADLQYFTFRIGLVNGNGDVLKENINEPQEYQSRIEYFSFAMQKDLRLVDGQDTLPCVIYHFERSYGVAPHCNFNLAFEKGGDIGNKTLIFDDQLLGIGRVKLTIKEEDINSIPALKTT